MTRNLGSYLAILSVGFLGAIFVRSSVLTAYRVPTGSMQPALKPGDLIFAYRKAYPFQWSEFMRGISSREVRRGDIIAFSFPSQPQTQYVKRVVGLPGDILEIEGNHLRINGEALKYEGIDESENLEDNPNSDAFNLVREVGAGLHHTIILSKQGVSSPKIGPLKIPEGHVYMLGDNRDTSDDSRYWGPVPWSHIIGRVFVVWLSIDGEGKVRWRRILKVFH